MLSKLKHFKYYKKQLNKYKDILKSKFGIKIDRIYRMGFVVSINNKEYETYDEHINGFNSLVEDMSKRSTNLLTVRTQKKLEDLDNFFINEMKIEELYGIYEKEQIDDFNYKIIIGFKPFNTLYWANTLWSIGIFVLGCTVIGSVIAGMLLLFL